MNSFIYDRIPWLFLMPPGKMRPIAAELRQMLRGTKMGQARLFESFRESYPSSSIRQALIILPRPKAKAAFLDFEVFESRQRIHGISARDGSFMHMRTALGCAECVAEGTRQKLQPQIETPIAAAEHPTFTVPAA